MSATYVNTITDELTIVWFGPFGQHFLSKTINFSHTFESIETCLSYLHMLKDSDRIYFVMASTTYIDLIPRILQCSQILWLYLLTDAKTDPSLIREARLRGTFYAVKDLLGQLHKDIRFFYRSLSATWNVFDWPVDQYSLSKLDTDNASFVWHQLLLDTILKLTARDYNDAKREFLAECRHVYRGDDIEMERINRFERDYISSDAIQWYSDDGFVFRLLNQALRTQNIDIIYKCRFMFREIRKQLQDVQQSADLPIDIVYRSQPIIRDELEKLRRSDNGLIAMSSFLSTSVDEQVAQMYLNEGPIVNDREWLLLTIHIDDQSATSSVFAYIATNGLSKKPDEMEVLFVPGTVFRIETPPFRQSNENFWRMQLTLAQNDQCAEINHAMNVILTARDRHPVSLLTIGSILAELGQSQSALRFYQMFLQQATPDFPNADYNLAAITYSDIGSLYYDNGYFNKAIRSFDSAFELFWQRVPHDFGVLIKICTNKGVVFTDAARYPEAMFAFVCALILLQIVEEVRPLTLHWEIRVRLYNNIGLLAQRMRYFRASHSYYERTIAILERYCPHDYIRLNTVYLNIATLYHDCQQYEEAIVFYERVITIQEKVLPPKHAFFSKSYTGIALCHANRGSMDEALRYMNMSLEIEHAQDIINHVTFAACCSGLAVVSTFRREHDKALKWAFEAHDHARHAGLADDHPDMQLYQKSVERAIQNFEQSTISI